MSPPLRPLSVAPDGWDSESDFRATVYTPIGSDKHASPKNYKRADSDDTADATMFMPREMAEIESGIDRCMTERRLLNRWDPGYAPVYQEFTKCLEDLEHEYSRAFFLSTKENARASSPDIKIPAPPRSVLENAILAPRERWNTVKKFRGRQGLPSARRFNEHTTGKLSVQTAESLDDIYNAPLLAQTQNDIKTSATAITAATAPADGSLKMNTKTDTDAHPQRRGVNLQLSRQERKSRSENWSTVKMKIKNVGKSSEDIPARPTITHMSVLGTQFSPLHQADINAPSSSGWLDRFSPKLTTFEQVQDQMHEQEKQHNNCRSELPLGFPVYPEDVSHRMMGITHTPDQQLSNIQQTTKSRMPTPAQETMHEKTSCTCSGWCATCSAYTATSCGVPSEKKGCSGGWGKCSECSNRIGSAPGASAAIAQPAFAEATQMADNSCPVFWDNVKSDVATVPAQDRQQDVVKVDVNPLVPRKGSELQDIPATIRDRIYATWLSENEQKEAAAKSGKQTVQSIRGEQLYAETAPVNAPSFDVDNTSTTTSPDSFLIAEFMEVTDYKFTRNETLEILRICGANLDAAIAMYRNAHGPLYLRQMLLTWFSPPQTEGGLPFPDLSNKTEIAKASTEACRGCWEGCDACCPVQQDKQDIVEDHSDDIFWCADCDMYVQGAYAGDPTEYSPCGYPTHHCKADEQLDTEIIDLSVMNDGAISQSALDTSAKSESSYRKALVTLGLGDYKSVIWSTLSDSLATRLSDNAECNPERSVGFAQAFNTVSKYQDKHDSWVNCHIWTDDTDEMLLNWKTENPDLPLSDFAEDYSLYWTVAEVMERFQSIQPKDWKSKPAKQGALKKKQTATEDPVIRAATPEDVSWSYEAFGNVGRGTSDCMYDTQWGTAGWDTDVGSLDDEYLWKELQDNKLMEMKKEYAKVTWGVVPEKLGVPVEECKGRFEEIKPKDWKPNTTRKTGGKNGDVQEKNKGRSKAIYVRPATPGQTDWVDPWECRDAFGGDAQVGGATDPWDADCVGKPTEVKNYVCDNNCQNCLDNRCHCSASGSGWDNALCTSEIHGKSPAANSSGDDCWDTSVYGLDNICGRAFEKSIRNGAASLQAKGDCCDAPAQQSQCVGAPNDLRGFGGCPNNVNVNKKDNDLMPAPTTYTVTYWVTIEAGDKSIHIPIDGKNISSPEKTIVEGSAGMKKVWKWVQEKGLGDKVGLQDAFDLAKDMHSEDEGEEWVIDQAQHAVHTSHASSRRSSPSPSDGWPRCS